MLAVKIDIWYLVFGEAISCVSKLKVEQLFIKKVYIVRDLVVKPDNQ